jgi:hypothetical protein
MKFEEAYEIKPMLPKTSLRKSLTTFWFLADFHLEGDLRPCFWVDLALFFTQMNFCPQIFRAILRVLLKSAVLPQGDVGMSLSGLDGFVGCFAGALLGAHVAHAGMIVFWTSEVSSDVRWRPPPLRNRSR